MEIVISKYKENIDWISNIKGHKITIYNKGDFDKRYINLPNIGREAHTYLYHIIENYENLEDHICFLQGNPFDHLNVDISKLNMEIENKFKPLNFEIICNLDGYPNHPRLELDKLVFDNFFIDKPNNIKFSPGAQFIVNKKSILNREKNFYIEMMNQFHRNDINDYYHKVNKMPWVMERVWYYIFNEKYRTKYDI